MNSVTRLVLAVALATTFGVASAQVKTKIYKASGTVAADKIATYSTDSVFPPIQPDFPWNPRMAAENDVTPPPPREPANKLKAGGLLSTSRGTPGHYFPGPTDGRFVPADPQMAVGPTNIVCIINSTIAFFTRNGTKIFEQQIDGSGGFFGSVAQTTFVFDPKAFYDSISHRFFVIADDGADPSGNGIDLAVSKTNNPTGGWFMYHFNSVFNGSWLDYPGFGFNKDAIVVTGNLFSGTGSGIEALVIPKAPLLNGGNANATVINDPNTFTIQPARTTDSTIDKIFGVATGGGNALQVFAFTNVTGAAQLQEVDVAVPAYNRPSRPANSEGNPIDSLDGRQMTCNYRNGQVVAAHTIDNNGSDAVRWYDFVTNSWPTSGQPALKQAGTIAQNGVDIHMPAININFFEDITVFFSRCGSSTVMDLCYAARKKGDPLGQIGQPVKLFGSTNAGYGGRWGDYFANEIDPNDDSTFWGFGMAINGGQFNTQVLNWTVTVGSTGTAIPPNAITPFVGTYLAGDITSVSAVDGNDYLIDSAPITQFGEAAGAEVDFTVTNPVSTVSFQFVAAAGVTGGTNMVWAFNNVTQKFDLIGSTPLAASGSAIRTVTIPSSNLSKYIGPGGLVRTELRGHIPIKPFQNSMPAPFTYALDMVQLLVR